MTSLRPVVVLLNPSSGTGATHTSAERVVEVCAALGYHARVTATQDLGVLCRAAETAIQEGADSLLVGGGDGTLSRIASLLVDSEVALGVLPLGSFNHFARDLDIPLRLEDAAAVALTGATRRCDVGEVNGKVFINNSSLGLYPLIVRLRERHWSRGLAKWLATAWTALREIRRPRDIAVRLAVAEAGQPEVQHTPIVFIGNNRYRAEGLAVGTRESLQDGLLAIYVVKARARRHLLRLLWRMLRARVQPGELEVRLTAAATLETAGARILVANDGEVEALESPLAYRIRAAALKVKVPPGSDPSGAEPPPVPKYTPTTTVLPP